MAQYHITLTEAHLHGLFTGDGRDQAFSKLLEEIFNQVLLHQSKEQIGAEPYERTDQRRAYRNGYRNRELTTRVGTLTLRVPRHRNGEFSTELFEQYQRSEQALVLAMLPSPIDDICSCGRRSSMAGADSRNGHQRRLNPKSRTHHRRTVWQKVFQIHRLRPV